MPERTHHAKPALSALDCAIIRLSLRYVPLNAVRGLAEKYQQAPVALVSRTEELERRFVGMEESLNV